MDPTVDLALESSKQRLRVAYLLARGHRFRRILNDKDAIDDGHSFTKLARACSCSKARISQIIDLTLLNYSIQEEILAMEKGKGKGREPITEHDLRWAVRVLEPVEQNARWGELLRRKKGQFLPASTPPAEHSPLALSA